MGIVGVPRYMENSYKNGSIYFRTDPYQNNTINNTNNNNKSLYLIISGVSFMLYKHDCIGDYIFVHYTNICKRK